MIARSQFSIALPYRVIRVLEPNVVTFLELDLGTFCSLLRALFLIILFFVKAYEPIFQPLFNIAEITLRYDSPT